jgi:septal ring factor EnvC (AmiA/AmiB activator)
MKRFNFILLNVFFILAGIYVHAQTIDELKQKKEKTRKEIEYTNWLLNKTGQSSKASLRQLNLLNEQISLRNKLISEHNQQLSILQQSINDNEQVIKMLSADLNEIRHEYARLVQQANRQRGDYNQLIFILSSQSFNQAYKRLLYVRQMARHRQKQLEQIEAIRAIIQNKVDELTSRQKEKEQVIEQQMQEFSNLQNEKNNQSATYNKLQKKQRDLKQHLRLQQRIEKRLEAEIERIIAEEARKAREIARTPEFNELSDNFSKNKGKLPWPTRYGVITDKFGEHAHPAMRNIIINNNGIDITTRPGEKARAIFTGIVSRIFAIPGGNTAVIIRHGEFISVYSNLNEIYVSQGQTVNRGDNIGAIYVDKSDDDNTILKFQIWKENVKLNPEEWIAR